MGRERRFARRRAIRRWSSTSPASKVRSTCCCIWPATRRSIWRASRSWRWPSSICSSSSSARALRLELAADYLVMAAWLAFLKSKLLIPKQPGDDGESGEELAAVLQFRLKRLEAMRDAAARLVNRNRLGRDVFARGMPELVIVEKRNEYSAIALRPPDRLCRAAPAPGDHQCPDRQARRLVAEGGARHPDAADRRTSATGRRSTAS